MRDKICEIAINGGEATKNAVEYDFTFSSVPVSMYLTIPDKVCIDVHGEIIAEEDILAMPEFYSLLCRAHLAYALTFDSGLNIKKIRVNDEWYDAETEKHSRIGFPFVYSAIGNRLGLSKKWRDKQFIEKMLSYKQIALKDNSKFSAVYSFIAANSCEREIEKFYHLWSCMNSYYRTKAEEASVNRWWQERAGIQHLLGTLGCRQNMILRTNCNRPETKRKYRQLVRILNCISDEELPLFYEACAKNDFNNIGNLHETAEQIDRLNITRLNLFGLLLLEFPYYLRCNYFHGAIPTVLFEYTNNFELSALRVGNFFLREFLNDRVPEMFATIE